MATTNMEIMYLQEPEELQAMEDHPKTLRCYFFSVSCHSLTQSEQQHPPCLFRKQFKGGIVSRTCA